MTPNNPRRVYRGTLLVNTKFNLISDSLPMIIPSAFIIFILSLIYEWIQNENREIISKIFTVKSVNEKEELLTMMLHLRKFPKIFGFFRVDFVNSTDVRMITFLLI